MRYLTCILFFLIPFFGYCSLSPQMPDQIEIDGEEHEMDSYPLFAHPEIDRVLEEMYLYRSFDSLRIISTGCTRPAFGEWVLQDSMLYLKSLSSSYAFVSNGEWNYDSQTDVSILFATSYDETLSMVPATWFTGNLSILSGHPIDVPDGYGWKYSEYTTIEIKDGRLLSKNIISNEHSLFAYTDSILTLLDENIASIEHFYLDADVFLDLTLYSDSIVVDTDPQYENFLQKKMNAYYCTLLSQLPGSDFTYFEANGEKKYKKSIRFRLGVNLYKSRNDSNCAYDSKITNSSLYIEDTLIRYSGSYQFPLLHKNKLLTSIFDLQELYSHSYVASTGCNLCIKPLWGIYNDKLYLKEVVPLYAGIDSTCGVSLSDESFLQKMFPQRYDSELQMVFADWISDTCYLEKGFYGFRLSRFSNATSWKDNALNDLYAPYEWDAFTILDGNVIMESYSNNESLEFHASALRKDILRSLQDVISEDEIGDSCSEIRIQIISKDASGVNIETCSGLEEYTSEIQQVVVSLLESNYSMYKEEYYVSHGSKKTAKMNIQLKLDMQLED